MKWRLLVGQGTIAKVPAPRSNGATGSSTPVCKLRGEGKTARRVRYFKVYFRVGIYRDVSALGYRIGTGSRTYQQLYVVGAGIEIGSGRILQVRSNAITQVPFPLRRGSGRFIGKLHQDGCTT
jgi:hypothetical protein